MLLSQHQCLTIRTKYCQSGKLARASVFRFLLKLRYVSLIDSLVSDHDPKPSPQITLLVFLTWPSSALNHNVTPGQIADLFGGNVKFFTAHLQYVGSLA